jgi:hypothetical protein
MGSMVRNTAENVRVVDENGRAEVKWNERMMVRKM